MNNPLFTAVQTFILIFVLVVILLIAEIHHRVTVMFVAVLLTIYFGVQYRLFSLDQVYSFVDYEVILFILGIFILFESLAKSNLFEYISYKLFSFTEATPKKTYFLLILLTFLLSVFVSNITAIAVIGGLTISLYKRAGIDLEKALIAEAVVTNIGGLVLPISSVPNVIVSSTVKIGVTQFVTVAFPISLVLLAFFVFITLKTVKKRDTASFLGSEGNETFKIEEKKPTYKAFLIFISFLLLLILNERINVPPYLIAMSLATVMLWFSGIDPKDVFKAINWEPLFFVASFYVFVEGVKASGVLDIIIHLLNPLLASHTYISAAALTLVSGFISAFIDNIPVTLLLLPIASKSLNPTPLYWSIILGGNLGGNLTPFGSPSVIIALSMLKERKGKINQVNFLKISILPTVLCLIISSIYLLILNISGFI